VTILCRCLRVTRSGFYAWQGRPESTHARDDRRLKVLVRVSFEESKQRYGSPRVYEDLLEQHEHVSRKRVVRLMQEDGLVARLRKRYKLTTMSDHDQPVAANLLDRQFEADAPNQRWVGDTTEFVIGPSGNGKLYLAAILDLFSRFIVGWAVSAVNDRHLTIKALEMALLRRCPEIGLLHHSDQGSTYASEDYQDVLDARGIVCSMSRRGNCWDNAVMESFFSTVKSELADRFDSCGEAKMELFDYIELFYNQRRRHSTLGQISPAAYERQSWREPQEVTIPRAAERVMRGGIAQVDSEGDRRSWGILGGCRFSDRGPEAPSGDTAPRSIEAEQSRRHLSSRRAWTPWKTAQTAVFHRAHTHHFSLRKRNEEQLKLRS
jgi:putative transposase